MVERWTPYSMNNPEMFLICNLHRPDCRFATSDFLLSEPKMVRDVWDVQVHLREEEEEVTGSLH